MELKDYTEEPKGGKLEVLETIGKHKYKNRTNMEINWEQRRYEIAKDILTAWCSNPDRGTGLGIPKNDSAAAVRYADALIEELKKK